LKLTAAAIPALAAAAFAMSCGSSAGPAAAQQQPVGPPGHCDRFASPGAGNAQRLADRLHPGETGCLHGGDYVATGPDGYVLRFGRGGRRGAPLRIRSAPGERASLRGIVYVVHGSDHVTLSDVTLDGRHPRRPAASQNSIQVFADHAQILRNDITNHGVRSCVIIGDDARRPVLRANVFHDCGDPANHLLDHAIYDQSSRRARISQNVFLRSGGWAVQLYPAARRSRVTGNLMWDNGGGVVFGGDGGSASSGNVVSGNVIAASRQRPELTGSFGGPIGRGNVARHNCLAPGLEANDNESGFRMVANRITDGPACLASASSVLVDRLSGVAPALVSRLRR
jgi:hypothetical protein